MPLYEYECSACEERFELMQPVKARPPRRCPECGASGTVTKRIAAPAFQLKGSGWYVTDYARKSDRRKANAAKSGDGDGGSSTAKEAKETKTEGTAKS